MAQTTGRRPSERTLVIRKALDENPELTWSQIVERGVFPAALGVTQRNFDATKHLWQKQQAKAIRVRKIRKAIKANPDLTYQQAVEDEVFKPELGVTEDLFNAVKAKLNGDQPRRTNGTRSATPRRTVSTVQATADEFTQRDFREAIEFIRANGGVEAVEKKVAAYKAFKTLNDEMKNTA